ncbi:MAG: LysM peptidoglycan-binding domain-containing protein [Myxococcota bacterium]
MRSLSFLWAVALAAIWVDAARAEAVDTASADATTTNQEAGAPADDDPFAEFAGSAEADAASPEPEAAPTQETPPTGQASEASASAGSDPAGTAGRELAEATEEPAPVDPSAAPLAGAESGDAGPGAGAAAAAGSAGTADTGSDWETPSTSALDEGWAAVEPAPEPSAAPAPSSGRSVVIGPIGVDEAGRRGRIHTVARGDTLWDISNAYLGTPWVWPSVWHENDSEIENPHVIRPGELIWITSTEMRKVSSEEAEVLMATAPAEMAGADSGEGQDLATAGDPSLEEEMSDTGEATAQGPAAVDVEVVSIDLPADIDADSLSMPSQSEAMAPSGATIRIASRETMSFVSSETVEASTSIVESPFTRTWLAEGDTVIVGFGEGEVEPGDQFTVFRDHEPVRDMDGGLLGYHVDVRGWLEIVETHPESATALVKVSVGSMRVGDMLAPREVPAEVVAIREAPTDFEGHVIHFPNSRTVVGDGDYVYLDRGAIHGLEVGSRLEVITGGDLRRDVVRRARVETPQIPVAELVVTSVRPDASVAVVSRSQTEIERGARVRAAADRVASAR